MEAGIILENNPVESHPAEGKTTYNADMVSPHNPTMRR